MDKIFRLKRTSFKEKTTGGILYSPEGKKVAFTLEDRVRNHKIFGETAIPAGTYQMILVTRQDGRKGVKLMSVPFYTGILIHVGNTHKDSKGCILLGMKKASNAVYESRKAFAKFLAMVENYLKRDEVFIQIDGGLYASEWIEEDNVSLD